MNPQGLDAAIAGRGSQMIAITKYLKEQGWKGPFYGTGADISAVKEGVSFMEGLTIPVMADIKSETVTKTERDILQRYVAKFPEADLEPPMLVTYNAVQVYAAAMEKAGTVDDAVKIAQVLRDNEWDTVWSEKIGKSKFVGKQTLGEAVTLEQQIYLSGVRDGKLVTFGAIKGTLP